MAPSTFVILTPSLTMNPPTRLQVALGIDYHHNMLLSHQKVNPKEVIVGWYSTVLGVTGGSALIHEFYSREVPNPIHLTVDARFGNGAVDILKTTMVDKIPSDLEVMEASMQQLLALNDNVFRYVYDVVEGLAASCSSIGWLISETVASFPNFCHQPLISL